jgi:uncharacterized protein (UPF0276 family)
MLSDIIGSIGLGLRREFIDELQKSNSSYNIIQYLEVAPENWMNMGGNKAKQIAWFSEHYPIVAHGLSLSLGGTDHLDIEFLKQIKTFINQYNIKLYTEHVSFTGANGNLYDLLPIPFNEESANNIINRIKIAQDILGKQIAIENASYYSSSPLSTMTEPEFICEVLEKADCLLQLDINNVYVNSRNFDFDAYKFLDAIPKNRVVYMHVAGHDEESENLLIDTHGQPIRTEVWNLLAYSYKLFGIQPTTLERDLNMPEFREILSELEIIKDIQEEYKTSLVSINNSQSSVI